MSFRLLEDLLRYIHSIAQSVEENANKPTAKFWRVLLNKAYDVLDKVWRVVTLDTCFKSQQIPSHHCLVSSQVNALLPTDTFIVVMRGLMGNDLPSVRRKAMELLNNKLVHRTQWDQEQVTATVIKPRVRFLSLLTQISRSSDCCGHAARQRPPQGCG